VPAKLRILALFVGLCPALGSGCATTAPSPRSLHEVDGEVVYSRPPSPGAYEAYLRARLALDADPPRPEEALGFLEQLQRTAPHDPHLWATKAEALALMGEYDEARTAAQRSLAISPEYPKAQRVLASLPGAASSASAAR
jgi:predicted Zn-dependent protease